MGEMLKDGSLAEDSRMRLGGISDHVIRQC